MGYGTRILIGRSHKRNIDHILKVGEPFYCIETKELFIGDGSTMVKDLEHITILNNIVKGKDGKLYRVNIDEEGNVSKTVITYHSKYNGIVGDMYVTDNILGTEDSLELWREFDNKVYDMFVECGLEYTARIDDVGLYYVTFVGDSSDEKVIKITEKLKELNMIDVGYGKKLHSFMKPEP